MLGALSVSRVKRVELIEKGLHKPTIHPANHLMAPTYRVTKTTADLERATAGPGRGMQRPAAGVLTSGARVVGARVVERSECCLVGEKTS
jgi:hypothetical protein